jgi:hypothetical protein
MLFLLDNDKHKDLPLNKGDEKDSTFTGILSKMGRFP